MKNKWAVIQCHAASWLSAPIRLQSVCFPHASPRGLRAAHCNEKGWWRAGCQLCLARCAFGLMCCLKAPPPAGTFFSQRKSVLGHTLFSEFPADRPLSLHLGPLMGVSLRLYPLPNPRTPLSISSRCNNENEWYQIQENIIRKSNTKYSAPSTNYGKYLSISLIQQLCNRGRFAPVMSIGKWQIYRWITDGFRE